MYLKAEQVNGLLSLMGKKKKIYYLISNNIFGASLHSDSFATRNHNVYAAIVGSSQDHDLVCLPTPVARDK